jgi:hypothetical protein
VRSGHGMAVTPSGASSSHVDPAEGIAARKRRLGARSHSSATGSTARDRIGDGPMAASEVVAEKGASALVWFQQSRRSAYGC